MFLVAFFVATSFVFLLNEKVYAESYALYVDAGAEDGGDGSKDKPFQEVEDAIEEVKSGENIYIAGGTYDGNFKIPSSVGLYGQSRDNVKIKGSLNAANGVILKNITISGGNVALTVESGAYVSVKKCIVRDASKIGIDIASGNGKLTVEDTKITNNRKGVYAQRGNQLRISDSTISKNKEEGIDIRNKVDGSITGNEISNNGESGIEIILGSSDMSIANNNISSNSASGIAAQFYSDFSKKGKVKVDNNKIKNNNHFGIKCGAPSGGNSPKGYWEKSLNLNDNIFGGNDEGDIAGKCKITLDDESDESIKKVAAAAEEEEKNNPVGELVDEKEKEEIAEETEQQVQDKINETKAEIDSLKQEIAQKQESISQNQAKLRKRYTIFYLISGPDKNVLANAESGLSSYKNSVERLQEIHDSATDDNIKNELEGTIASVGKDVLEKENAIKEVEKASGFWYRLKSMFSF